MAPTDEEALAIARPYLDKKYKAYVDWGQSDVLPPTDTLRRDWADLLPGRFILRSPATAVKQLQEVVGRLNPTEIQFRVQWPGMPHEQVMQSLKLLATEVIPRL